ncbi:MAG: peptide deformylase [Paracoccus sp. (in: a-proteobacteria)]|uniref:peptide deformylase n=1 Tax=Paracoccus sp. TaxID=267 RepID=UPI0026E03284|nr:peptide deformylase [Paracoccus sp. (in: a-proteobacteria)]MDO5611678.1 peptide deformylase [Paracoccus sp. (in: a-proteobacteria)]
MTKPAPDGLPPGKVRPIVMHPDPLLRSRAEPVGYLDGQALMELAGDLFATMYAAQGRGLAAPQIGVSRRAFVMDAGWKEGRPDPVLMLDPAIIMRSTVCDEAEEACLSIPGQPVMVSRPTGIEILFYDLNGMCISRALQGMPARIAQHEFDHLEGRLVLDYLP